MSTDTALIPGISIVIPVYNSRTIVPALVARLDEVRPQLADDVEVILVNDGSPDGSWQAIVPQIEQHDWLHGINLMRNYGQHNALLCGIRAARHAVIVTMDDDLQHPPEEIPRLLAALAEGNDVVYGYPEQEEHDLWRALASRFTKLVIQRAMGVKSAQQVSAFRAFKTHVREAFADYRGPDVNLDVLLTWGTTRFTSIVTRHDDRYAGQSNYTFGKLVRHAVNMMTGFSTLPLQLASLMGFLFTFLGMGLLIYTVVRTLIERAAPAGFPTLASAIAIFSGVQLFSLGIIGEYLARMYFRMLDRPTYTVRIDTTDE